MDTSGHGKRGTARSGVATISRRAARPVAGTRVRPELVPPPAVDPAGRPGLRPDPEAGPQPRNARPAPSAAAPWMTPPSAAVPPAARPPATALPATALPATAPPATAPPTAAPAPEASPRPRPRPRPRAVAAPGSHRMPFVLLLCALLGGALVCALVISTTLAEGSFEITGLQQSANALARQRQALEEQVAQAQSAQVIENRALALGMRPQGKLRFIDLKTGKISSDQGNSWENAINVPGYTP